MHASCVFFFIVVCMQFSSFFFFFFLFFFCIFEIMIPCSSTLIALSFVYIGLLNKVIPLHAFVFGIISLV